MTNTAPIELEQLFRFFRDLPHQRAAVSELQEAFQQPGATYATVMRRDQPWFKTWSTDGKQQDRPAQQQQSAPATPGRVTPTSPFTARLTPHIQVGEFALFQEVRRFQHQHQVDTAAELAAFLERVRSQFGGKPVIITSGYRPPAVNRSVGGASASEHLYDAPGVGAVDFYVKDASITAVQAWCDKEWPYSLGYGAPKGFVHLGIRRGRPRVRWDY